MIAYFSRNIAIVPLNFCFSNAYTPSVADEFNKYHAYTPIVTHGFGKFNAYTPYVINGVNKNDAYIPILPGYEGCLVLVVLKNIKNIVILLISLIFYSRRYWHCFLFALTCLL